METKRYDVVVVGGGFAGVGAAIAAARQGKKVRLVEKYNCLGGAAVYDLVNPFMRYWSWTDDQHSGRIMLSEGIFAEIVKKLADMGAFSKGNKTHFNEELLKLLLNRMMVEAGVELLYQTTVVGAKRNGNKIDAITVSNVSGTYDIEADVFIDASGDANLAHLAGFPYKVGRESDGLCQPMTLCFRLANVDAEGYQAMRAEINELYSKFQAEGKITNPRENVLVFNCVAKNMLHFNTTRVVKLDPTNAEDVTKAEIIAREQVFEMVNFLRENFEPFKNADLVSTGIQIGVRESRMIVGEHTLSQEEMLAYTKFEDGIAACNYDIDIHSPDGSGTSHYYFPSGKYYTIPYGCLVPKDSENLLVAGRCISTTHEAQASIRIMPTVCTIGEAAGVAAAVACEDKTAVKSVDVQKVRARLRENGAVID
ncbi:MAG: FAD-dependent oxidoreductase [Clostridia bacterium]|nr:FAD-dependent oxidoreductase [Clostridia bacterium]